MAVWATGVVELPGHRRLADWIGGLTVVTILILWAGRNKTVLAEHGKPRPRASDRLSIRLIRSRRPPLAETAGPDIRPLRRRPPRS
jgi:hypothetical protein